MIGKILATIACLLVGPFFVWKGLSELITASRAKSWPTVQGTVTSSSLQESSGRRGRTKYTPVIKYGYEVNGKTYTGDRIDTGGKSTSSIDFATETLSRYAKGQAVTVYYESKSPEISLLQPGTAAENWLVFAIGLIMTGAGVTGGRSLWHRYRSNDFAPSSGL